MSAGTRLKAAVASVRNELRRTNFAGRSVTLGEGVAVAAALVGVGAAASRGRGGRAGVEAAALAAIAALGLVDDIVEPRRRRSGDAVAKGLAGHLGALRRGRVTTGAAKALGIPAIALVQACAAPKERAVLEEAMLVAGLANLLNLLDLRPGRALKATLLISAPLALAGPDSPRARAERR